MSPTGLLFIDGKWTHGSGQSFTSINPATEKVVWSGHSADGKNIDQAVASARNAFPNWSALPLYERTAFLEKFRDCLLKEKNSLSEAISINTGKPLWESTTEVDAMVNKIAISIDAFHTRCPTIEKPQANGQSITTHRAHGVMAVLGPFNFPGHLPNGHIIPALLAGNTVVFKPSELAPLVAELTLKCWEASGLPSGVINLVQGTKETGRLLSEHPGIDGLLFTGSWQTGKHLAELMAKTPYKILALEMGGNNALVIGNIKDMKSAAYLTILSAYLTSGQRCTCARRLIIPQGRSGDEFLKILTEMLGAIHIGPYDDPMVPFMGPVISKHAADALLNAQTNLIHAGAVPIVPLARLNIGKAFVSPGLIDVTNASNRPDEEYFGPFLQVIRVANYQAALEEVNKTQYGLTAGLFGDDPEEYEHFFRTAKAGIINWNTPLTGASSAAPFGGIGQSGNNRPSAFYAADYCAYPIASLVSPSLKKPSSISPGINTRLFPL